MNYIEFESLPSTNNYMKEHINELEDFTIITTKRQTQGRGRQGHTWYSSDDDLMFSLLIKKRRDAVHLSQIMALALIKALKHYGIEGKIKWPNDIYVNDQKIAGILCETVYQKDYLGTVIGVGLNINNANYLSLTQLTHHTLVKTTLLTQIINVFSTLLIQNYQIILNEINTHSYLKDFIINDPKFGMVQYKELTSDNKIHITNQSGQSFYIQINEVSIGIPQKQKHVYAPSSKHEDII